MMLAQGLLLGGIGIVGFLGMAHLVFTYATDKLQARDEALNAQMRVARPVVSNQTTVARAMIGFNASHSLGLLLFGLVYGYLVLNHFDFLLASPFLIAVQLGLSAAYIVLSKLYWFNVPFFGSMAAFVLMAVGYAVALV